MPANNTFTVTGLVGPGQQLTAVPITNVRELRFRFVDQVVDLVKEDGNIINLQFSNIDTVTMSIPVKGGAVTGTITE